jgi:glutamate synthase (NADPH/NADH) large chain
VRRSRRCGASGFNILIVSDRKVDRDNVAIPALLATSAVHQHLVTKGLRTSAGLVVETGSARETHHFALLAGYGAEAVHPYLALETLQSERCRDAEKAPRRPSRTSSRRRQGPDEGHVQDGHLDLHVLHRRADLRSHRPAEAPGRQVLHRHLDAGRRHRRVRGRRRSAPHAPAAFGATRCWPTLDAGGEYAFRVRGEEHMWTPDAIAKLQHATRANKFDTYKEYAKIINDQSQAPHDAARPVRIQAGPARPVPLEEVESAKEIVKRFATGAMSLGSISTEAHTTLAIAMNRIGGKSNTGEGGEDPKRFIPVKARRRMLSDVIGKGRIERDIQLKAGDACVRRSSRWRPAASASPPNTWSTPTRSRSRWRRAPSPAKAVSCPATRCPSTSASCVTRCRASA